MPQNNFKPFATGGGAYVISQAAFEALATLATGFNTGTAVKEQLNKVWRQSSFTSAVLQQFIAETLDSDSLDDGDLAAHVQRLRDALSAGSTNPIGSSMVRGLLAFNNAVSPTEKMDITASRVHFVDVNGKILVRDISATYTCDTGLGGPAENGRDQAGAFGANNWLYFYLILDPVADTVASIVSLTPPETFDGTTLPTGYTSWAFAMSVRFDSGSDLMHVDAQGDEVVYRSQVAVLSGGSATVQTTVSYAGVVPPNADMVTLNCEAGRASLGAFAFAAIEHDPGNAIARINTNAQAIYGSAQLRLPAHRQEFYYLWSAAATGRSLDINVMSYTIRNGG